jgi:hypothetical protein
MFFLKFDFRVDTSKAKLKMGKKEAFLQTFAIGIFPTQSLGYPLLKAS